MVETIQYGSITYKVIRGSAADGYSLTTTCRLTLQCLFGSERLNKQGE